MFSVNFTSCMQDFIALKYNKIVKINQHILYLSNCPVWGVSIHSRNIPFVVAVDSWNKRRVHNMLHFYPMCGIFDLFGLNSMNLTLVADWIQTLTTFWAYHIVCDWVIVILKLKIYPYRLKWQFLIALSTVQSLLLQITLYFIAQGQEMRIFQSYLFKQ